MRDRAPIPESQNTAMLGGNTGHFASPPMPRPLSWLPRLHEIRRTVANSVRSHYGRRDLEGLFTLQPRAAQKLLELLPTTAVGTSRLVEREALAGFLERVAEAEDIQAVFEAAREEKTQGSRRRLRTLVQANDQPVSLASPPESLTLQRGRLEVQFNTLEELAEAMYFLARALAEETEAFAQAYEPVPEPVEGARGDDVAELFAELLRLEEQHAAHVGMPKRDPVS